MDREKRKGDEPVPFNVVEVLNQMQVSVLGLIESYGWQLHFIRRPLFQVPVSVVIDADGKRFGTIEEDGKLNMEPNIKVR